MYKIIAILLTFMMLSTAGLAADSSDKPFVKKRYTIHGSAKVEMVEGQKTLVFSEDFKTKNGPDLKVYLSKRPLASLSTQDVDENAVRLSVLKSHRGSQSYIIPADINLDDFESVVIQCEAYSVLWGGFDL